MTAPSLATVAEYFRLGLEVGLLSPDQAVAWADEEIAAADAAPEGLVDVAWARGLKPALVALAAVPGERSRQDAGHGLLGLLGQCVPEREEDLQVAARRAMHIARHAELGDETYYRFDLIDDALSLARAKVHGTVEECRLRLAAELAEYQPMHVAGRSGRAAS